MLIKKILEGKIASSEITPKESFLSRRNFLTGAAALGVGALALKQVPGTATSRRGACGPEAADDSLEVHRAGRADAICEGDDLQQLL